MEDIVLLILGIVISIIGIVNMTGNISTVHSYNRRRVSEEDAPKYGKTVGLGTLVIGASMAIGYFLLLFELELAMTLVIVPALVAGVALILYAQFKYNKGIF